jgi:hypothetical protein
MVISNSQVHHVLRAYSQQLAERCRASRSKSRLPGGQKDEVNFSSESRKMSVADRIAQEILAQLTKSPEKKNETAQEVMRRLSQEFGKPLEIDPNGGDTFSFRIVNANGDVSDASLSAEEVERLRGRLLEITRSVVYDNLM